MFSLLGGISIRQHRNGHNYRLPRIHYIHRCSICDRYTVHFYRTVSSLQALQTDLCFNSQTIGVDLMRFPDKVFDFLASRKFHMPGFRRFLCKHSWRCNEAIRVKCQCITILTVNCNFWLIRPPMEMNLLYRHVPYIHKRACGGVG